MHVSWSPIHGIHTSLSRIRARSQGSLSWRSGKDNHETAQGSSSGLNLPLQQLQVALAARPASAWFLAKE